MYCRVLNLDVDQGTLMMEAARTSETSVDIQFRTWQHIPKILSFILATLRT
jgi:hypothetical protein